MAAQDIAWDFSIPENEAYSKKRETQEIKWISYGNGDQKEKNRPT